MTVANGVGHSAPTTSGRNLRALLRELITVEHVRGGLIVAPDGLLIASELPSHIPVEALSALAATLGRELEVRGPRLRRGSFLMANFAAGDGSVFLGGTPVGFIKNFPIVPPKILGGGQMSKQEFPFPRRARLIR